MTAPLPRIAYLSGWYPAVSLTFILREVEALRALGAEVETCAIRETNEQGHLGAAETHAAETTFYVLSALKKPATLLKSLGRALSRPAALWRTVKLAWQTSGAGLTGAAYQMIYLLEAIILARHLEERGVTHIHNHFMGASATVAMFTSELTGIPYSVMLHGPTDLIEPYKFHLKEKIARARFVATISYFARSQAFFYSDPAHWERVKIIHCGVTPEIYGRAPSPREDPDRLELLFVGRVAPVKGLPILLEAMELLKAQGVNARLTVIGDGPARAMLEAKAAPLGEAVRFLGFKSQEEVAQAMSDCDVFTLPSFAEGVPVVLMEALAAKRAVVATNVAGVSELVEDGVNGFLVPPGHPERLAERIATLAADPARGKAMGEAGAPKVAQEFDIRIETARLARLMSGDLSGGPRPEPYDVNTVE